MEITMNISKIQIMLCVSFLSMWAMCGELMPFDCSMPIILGPIIEQMRVIEELCGTARLNRNWRNPAIWPSVSYVFEIMDCPLSVGKNKYDRIVQVKYDRVLARVCNFTAMDPKKMNDNWNVVDVLNGMDPLDGQNEAHYKAFVLMLDKQYDHIFRLFVKDGLVMKIEHMEPSNAVHVYSQTIKDKANAVHFDDAEYAKLSKEALLDIYKGECLWLRLPHGRHEAKIQLRPADDIQLQKQRCFVGIIDFHAKALGVDFAFFDKEVRHLAVSHYRVSNQSPKEDKDWITYFDMKRKKRQNGNGYFITDAVFYDKWSNTDLRVQFNENLGLRKYSKGVRGVLKDILQWDENGANRKCYTAAQQQQNLANTTKTIGMNQQKE